jgi:folate-binding protein YgfZ
MTTPDHAAYDAVRTQAGLFDVSQRGKIEVAGADATQFLHNLCTNDILKLPVGAGCEAFFCTAKAKVVAHVLIYRAPHSYWIDTISSSAATLMQHLDRYIISEQVELADRTAEFSQLHVAGPQAPALLHRSSGGALPELDDHQHLPLTAGCIMRRSSPLGLPGYDFLCRRDKMADLDEWLRSAKIQPVDAATYNILRVEAGTPLFGEDIDEERFVVEVGRIEQAICYTKGCYLGQEPIVMARDRGHVNRTLLGVKLSGEGPLAPGSKLLRDGTEVGQVTSSVVSPRLGPIGLAYLRRGSWDPGTELQVEGQERVARVTALPFNA